MPRQKKKKKRPNEDWNLKEKKLQGGKKHKEATGIQIYIFPDIGEAK